MSHEIDMSNGRANIAYRGEMPWHGLGFQIEAGDDVATIQRKAGLTFSIKKGAMQMVTEDGSVVDASSLKRSVLYRDDTMAPLSVMSTDKYHIVQPDEIVKFIAESAEAMGWSIETVGSLKGGRKIWALANMGMQDQVGKGDTVTGYLLAATACDGSMGSEFLFTTVRAVCQNTVHMALSGGGDIEGKPRVKVYHFNKLDVAAVKRELGIASTMWERFIESARLLSKVKLTEKKALNVLRTVYDTKREEKQVSGEVISDEQFLKENTTARRVLELYQGEALGSDLASARGTAWGLVNAATQYYDHTSKTWSVDNRLNSAWFGKGATTKQDVVDACLELV